MNWYTRYSPSSTRLSMPTTTHWLPKRRASSVIRAGRSRAGLLTLILSAPSFSTCSASATLRMPPATQNGMSSTAATRRIQPRSTDRPSGLAVMS